MKTQMIDEHTYHECDVYEYNKLRTALRVKYDKESFFIEVSNSLGGKPYPQFTITEDDIKVTYWMRH